jgi:hypothetical protein
VILVLFCLRMWPCANWEWGILQNLGSSGQCPFLRLSWYWPRLL